MSLSNLLAQSSCTPYPEFIGKLWPTRNVKPQDEGLTITVIFPARDKRQFERRLRDLFPDMQLAGAVERKY